MLNKTNWKILVAALGSDSDKWNGQTIELMPAQVEFKGDLVDTIRVRVPAATPGPAPDDFDDDIPF